MESTRSFGRRWGISGEEKQLFWGGNGPFAGRFPLTAAMRGLRGGGRGGARAGGGKAELRQISANQRRGRGSAPAARSRGAPWVAVSRARGPARPPPRPLRRVLGCGEGAPSPEGGRGGETAALRGGDKGRGRSKKGHHETKAWGEGGGGGRSRMEEAAGRRSFPSLQQNGGRGGCRVGQSAGSGRSPWSLPDPILRCRERQVPGAVAAAELWKAEAGAGTCRGARQPHRRFLLALKMCPHSA